MHTPLSSNFTKRRQYSLRAVTSASEIKPEAYGIFYKKQKGSNWDTVDKSYKKEKTGMPRDEFQRPLLPAEYCRSHGLKFRSHSYCPQLKNLLFYSYIR